MLSRARKATITGLMAAVLGVVACLPDATLALEEFLGLRVLFGLRGPISPPPEIAIIGMDLASAEVFGAGREFNAWPRNLAAELIDILSGAGVRCIAYDVHFGERDDRTHDAALRSSIANAVPIVLLDYMARDEDRSNPAVTVVNDRRIQPLPIFRDGASATAPFPLQRRPYLVASYSTFLQSAHGAPTLPVALYALYAERSQRLLERVFEERSYDTQIPRGADLESRMRLLRETLRYRPDLKSDLENAFGNTGTLAIDARRRQEAATLIDLYSGSEQRYLNFYGPPQTFRTISMADVLERGLDPDLDWSRMVVLVGYSDRIQSSRDGDTFPTQWSTSSGRDLSGVEIAATAIANLMDGTALAPVLHDWQGLVIVAVFGLLLGVAVAPRSAPLALILVVLVTGLYATMATIRFAEGQQWWPMAVPVLLQAPAALFLSLFLSYRQEKLRQDALSRGASLYLPPELVERMSRDPIGDPPDSELIRGTCVATDVEGFTEYSERSAPRALELALNAYYERLYQIVRRNGGLVTDIVGDSMVAVWRDAPEPAGAYGAIAAATEIGTALGRSTDAFPRTRIGVHAGEFVLGSVGADQHLEYRAVGNVINSAARIQALNKILGTTILATRNAIGSTRPMQRYLGRFQLAGKAEVLEICELFPDSPAGAPDRLIEAFATALERFHAGEWRRAQAQFEAILDESPGDGPSRYFRDLSQANAANNSPPDWDRVLHIGD